LGGGGKTRFCREGKTREKKRRVGRTYKAKERTRPRTKEGIRELPRLIPAFLLAIILAFGPYVSV
jgi:hypothetical protein